MKVLFMGVQFKGTVVVQVFLDGTNKVQKCRSAHKLKERKRERKKTCSS